MTAEEQLAHTFVAEHPEDAARLLERVEPSEAAAILAGVKPQDAADALRLLAPSPAAACAAAIPDEALAAIIAAMPLDAGSATLRRVDAARRPGILERLDDERAARLRSMLSFPENSAGALADPLVLTLADDLTVADAQKQLRGSDRHLFYYLYVVRRDGTLVGALAIPELMAARAKDSLADVMQRQVVRLDAQMDLSTLLMHPAWSDYDAMPVVDANGKLVGAIRHKTVRRLSVETGRPMMATIVGLSELYWAGLSGILASFGGAPRLATERPHPGDADVT